MKSEMSNYDRLGHQRAAAWVKKGRRLTCLSAIARETAAALENVFVLNLNSTLLLLHKLLIGLQHKGQLVCNPGRRCYFKITVVQTTNYQREWSSF